jgi:hypothetical protein
LHVVHDNARANLVSSASRNRSPNMDSTSTTSPRPPSSSLDDGLLSLSDTSYNLLEEVLEDSCLWERLDDQQSINTFLPARTYTVARPDTAASTKQTQWTSTRRGFFQDEHPPSPTPNSLPVRKLSPEQGQEEEQQQQLLVSTPHRRPQLSAAAKKKNNLKVVQNMTSSLPLESPVTRKPSFENYSILEAIEPPLKSPLKRSKHSVHKISYAA